MPKVELVTRPNILVILSDEHTAAAAGWAGPPRVRTPHLDAQGFVRPRVHEQPHVRALPAVTDGRAVRAPDRGLGQRRHPGDEPAVRIPLLLRHPSLRPGRNDEHVSLVDVLPTLHDLSTDAALVARLDAELRTIVDPDRIDVLAKSDQAARLDERMVR